MSFKVPEKYRENMPDDPGGNNGVFSLAMKRGNAVPVKITVICSQDIEWEHCSIVIRGSKRLPNYRELTYVKSLFWSEDDLVVQYFPPKEYHVNNLSNCLHLFRNRLNRIATPPAEMVGILEGSKNLAKVNRLQQMIESGKGDERLVNSLVIDNNDFEEGTTWELNEKKSREYILAGHSDIFYRANVYKGSIFINEKNRLSVVIPYLLEKD